MLLFGTQSRVSSVAQSCPTSCDPMDCKLRVETPYKKFYNSVGVSMVSD